MSEPSSRIECGEHGNREATFVCQHLPKGRGAGFHHAYSDDDPAALFPDAWCDACEVVRQAEGEWTERSESAAGISVLCSACYLKARILNWPRSTQVEEADLVARSVEYLRARQDELASEFHLNDHERYDWDQATGELIFSNKGIPAVVADFQFVGSVSTRTDTWLWSWANDYDRESLRSRIREVRAYGEEHRILRLACAYWSAEETDGWEMAAVAAYLLQAKGAYRSPHGHKLSFLLLTDIRWAQ